MAGVTWRDGQLGKADLILKNPYLHSLSFGAFVCLHALSAREKGLSRFIETEERLPNPGPRQIHGAACILSSLNILGGS